MPDVLPSELMNSVMAKLYDVLTNGDEEVPQSEDNFFSWATPGIPVEASDFEFLSQGLTGVVKQADIEAMVPVAAGGGDGAAAAPPPEITPAMLEQLRAQDTAQLYMQAENFARLVDFVPDVTSASNEQFQRLSIMNNEGSLSDRYRYTLRMSQVMETELPEETKKKIEKYRNLLTVTTKKKNLLDDTETEVTGPSPVTQAYFEKMAAYEEKVLEYNTRRIDAMTASDARSVHFFATNASTLRNRVKAAMADWVANGYKNEYEEIAAFIDQVSQRDMALLKQEYRDDLEKARLTGLASGSDFFYTALVPGNFAQATGWTEFGFTSGNYSSEASSNYSSKKWEAKARGGFLGVFGGSGGGGSSSDRKEYATSFNSDHFGLNFFIAQVPIVRPWLKEAFLVSKAWRFDQNNPDAKSDVLNDGGTPPKGLIPAYPTTALFIRDLNLTFAESSGFSNFMAENESSHAGGGGSVSWGPFNLGGSYSRSSASGSTQRSHGFKFDGQTMKVPGMQLIGFKCHILPKSPDPLSTITEWI
jgi:hypothetical protein